MLNNLCVTCHAVGFVSFVHPSQPLEEENNFEIWGAWGIKLSMVWNILWIYCIILQSSTLLRFLSHRWRGWSQNSFQFGGLVTVFHLRSSRHWGNAVADVPFPSNPQVVTWGTPTMVSQRRTHSWAELSWPHKCPKMPNKKWVWKTKSKRSEESTRTTAPTCFLILCSERWAFVPSESDLSHMFLLLGSIGTWRKKV